MIKGHGDDLYSYGTIELNFSSNVYNSVDHSGLNAYLSSRLPVIRSYPEPEPYTLEREIAQRYGIGSDSVCVTNGATEAIYLIAQTWRGSRSLVLSPTFSEYADACRLHQHQVENIFSLEQLPEEPVLVWICNPNNPTGEVRDAVALQKLIRSFPQHLFILDQSYEMFAARPTLPVAGMCDCDHVIMLHSMTKCFAVPGIRLGYLTANPQLVEAVRSQRMPWSVNALAIEAGLYLWRHASDYVPDVESLIRERERVACALSETGQIEVSPSDTHYMLLKLLCGSAAALKDYLARNHRILIRDASNFAGLDGRYFRIAVQTPEENNRLITGIKSWIAQL